MVIALALLPEDRFEEGLKIIDSIIYEKFPRDRKLKKFMGYVKMQWRNKSISIFREIRTNNKLESYHRVINRKLQSRPHLKQFLGKRNFYVCLYVFYIFFTKPTIKKMAQ